MTLRPPGGNSRTTQVAALDYEIAQEQASALGRLGRALEAALSALASHDSALMPPRAPAAQPDKVAERGTRGQLVQNASEALWYFIVQREACDLRDARPVIREYHVPAEVYTRMGIFKRR